MWVKYCAGSHSKKVATQDRVECHVEGWKQNLSRSKMEDTSASDKEGERGRERQGWRTLGKKIRCNRTDIYYPDSEVSIFPSRKS